MSYAEFVRRSEAHPEIKKAEYIDGMVFVEVSVSPDHSEVHVYLTTLLGTYAATHPGTEAHSEVTVRLPGGDEVQPDCLLRQKDGTSRRGRESIEGPPELVIEVAVSSASYDLHTKREAYRRAGVREYAVFQVFEGRLDWWRLEGDRYEPLMPGSDGVVESREFPGLRVDVPKLVAGDAAGLLAALRPGEGA
jgi:Uma2 family endonuclease